MIQGRHFILALSLTGLWIVLGFSPKRSLQEPNSADAQTAKPARPAPKTVEKSELELQRSILHSSSIELGTNAPNLKLKKIPQPPPRDRLRDEVREDLHQNPESILEVASFLGDSMVEALENEAAAVDLFDELRACALDSISSATIQALCYKSARVLAETYPKIRTDFQFLEEQLPAEILNLTDPFNSNSNDNSS